MMNTTETVLAIQNVSLAFGGLQALSQVSFDVHAGEILGLIGPNGAGKTTLFNVIGGVYRPQAGRVVFRGADITGVIPYRIARLGIARTHQIVRPLGDLTVKENVTAGACFGREYLSRSQGERVAQEVLEFVELADKGEMLASALNVAEKKRLEMARALAARPFLLLLDEVLSGLNANEVAAMLAVIREIRNRGTTVIMIEHLMHAIMNVSGRIVALDYGKMIAEGKPDVVAHDPQVVEAYLGDPEETRRLLEGFT